MCKLRHRPKLASALAQIAISDRRSSADTNVDQESADPSDYVPASQMQPGSWPMPSIVLLPSDVASSSRPPPLAVRNSPLVPGSGPAASRVGPAG